MWECCFVNVHLAQDIFNIEYSQFSPLSTLNIFNSEYLCGSSVTFVNAHLALDIFNSEWTPSEHIGRGCKRKLVFFSTKEILLKNKSPFLESIIINKSMFYNIGK